MVTDLTSLLSTFNYRLFYWNICNFNLLIILSTRWIWLPKTKYILLFCRLLFSHKNSSRKKSSEEKKHAFPPDLFFSFQFKNLE